MLFAISEPDVVVRQVSANVQALLGLSPAMVLGTSFEGAIGGAILAGGLGALGAALYTIGIPRGSAIEYESNVKANRFLVMACGSAEQAERARAALKEFIPSHLDLHKGAKTADFDDHPAAAPSP